LGSIDFGAGFWAFIYGNRADTRAASIANRFLSPSWKVTNVFLVLLVVALVGFFPRATFMLGTLLLLPVSLVLILLKVRSTFLVYAYSSEKYRGALRIVSGVTGLLIPGLLISVLPITLGGYILMVADGFTNPAMFTSLLIGYSVGKQLSLCPFFAGFGGFS
jgi:cytochrome d ubiquinol oxidase subunit II